MREKVKAFLDNVASSEAAETLYLSLKGKSVSYDPEIKAALTALFDHRDLELQYLASPWFSTLSSDPEFSKIISLAKRERYWLFEGAAGRVIRDPSQNLADPLFLKGLQTLVLTSAGLERWLTFLRRYLLKSKAGKILPAEDMISIAASLAHYCFHTGYIFPVSKQEARRLDKIKKQLNAHKTLDAMAYEVAVLACYEPLHALPFADDIRNCFSDDPNMGKLIKETICFPESERRLAEEITCLTSVNHPASQMVMEQYAEFPYPQWKRFDRNKKLFTCPDKLKNKPLEILIAGCGTGQEAMYYSHTFPEANILAVDLSKTSLAYAIRQTRELGAKNISFAQADILELPGALNRTFDVISSSGVLHHMEEPEKGFAALDRLLKPGGIMRLALYSKTGRRSIRRAREIIAERGYGNRAEDIRLFRQHSEAVLPEPVYKAIIQAQDYFILPQCRDFLFNVIEHQMSLEEIGSLLQRYDYRFMEFLLQEDVKTGYRQEFPDDNDCTCLKNWEAFEQKRPDTFAAMYKFACMKKNGSQT